MRENQVFFSIIIPVYNVEDYLDECVQSVLNQTYTNWEMILVDDGSPDRCPQICDSYANSSRQICTLHQKNAGLSEARNTGLRKAVGEYVLFLDSDDYWLCSDFLEKVHDVLMDNQWELLLFKRRKYYEATGILTGNPKPFDEQCFQSITFSELIFNLSKADMLEESAAVKVIKRSVLISNKIWFKRGIYSEDVEWFYRFIRVVKTAGVINMPAYCYRIRAGSITHSIEAKNIVDLFSSIEINAEEIRDHCKDVILRKALLNRLLYIFCIALGHSNANMNGKDRKVFQRKCCEYKWLCSWACSPKTKLASSLIKLLGIKIASFPLGIYLKGKQ